MENFEKPYCTSQKLFWNTTMSDKRPIQLRRVIATVELDLDPHTPQHFSCRRYGELKSSERAMECIAIDRSR